MRRIRQVSRAFLPVGKLGLGLSFGLHAVAGLVPVWLGRCSLTQNLSQRYWTQLTQQTGLEEAEVARPAPPGPTYPRCLLYSSSAPVSSYAAFKCCRQLEFERTTAKFEMMFRYIKIVVLRTYTKDTERTHK